MKRNFIRIFVGTLFFVMLFTLAGCASCDRAIKSCNSDLAGGLYRTINVYSLDGERIATYDGLIDIDNNENGSICFELNGKRYIYYNAIIEVIEK